MNWNFLEIEPKHIERLWNFASSWRPYQRTYFSEMVGDGVATFLRSLNVLNGNVLDYGCGKGDLMARILDKNVTVSGLDYSPDSIATVRDRYKGHPSFGVAEVVTDTTLPFSDDSFDLVLSIETIEHLFPDDIVPTFERLLPLVKPGGYIFVTTPYEENLEDDMCFCPNCSTVFHRWLHFSSFDVSKLVGIMERVGFHTILCDHTDFRNFQKRKGKRHVLRQYLRNPLLRMVDIVFRLSGTRSRRLRADLGKGRSLFYVGRRPHDT